MKRFLIGFVAGIAVALLGLWLWQFLAFRRFGNESSLFEAVPHFVEESLPGSRVLDVSIGPDSQQKVNYVYDQLYDVHVTYELAGKIKKVVLVYGKAKGIWISPSVTDLVVLDDQVDVFYRRGEATATDSAEPAAYWPAPAEGSAAAYLVLRPLLAAPAPGNTDTILLHDKHYYFNSTEVLLSARQVDAETVTLQTVEGPEGSEQWAVTLVLTQEGAEIWRNWTERNVGSRIGIFLNGELLAAPVINTPMSSGFLILEGRWSRQDAESVAERLRRASTPSL